MARPTRYNKRFHPKLAEYISRAGLTDKQIADELGICERTLNNWKKTHKEFLQSIKKGKKDPDDKVESALYKRAIGYDYEERVIESDEEKNNNNQKTKNSKNKKNENIFIPTKIRIYKKHLPPDTAACFIWLKNRRSEKWRNDKYIKIEDVNKQPLNIVITPITKEQLKNNPDIEINEK